MSDEIRTADEAIEAAAQVAERTPNGEYPGDYAAAIRALAVRIPERDDEALVMLIEQTCRGKIQGLRGRAVLAALREAGALK